MKNSLLISLLLALLFIFSCKKDKDEIPPTITITNPNDNQQYTALDTVWVLATVTDESSLKQIEITLTDDNKTPILSTVVVTPETNSVTLKIPYVLNDINLASGSYYIWIRASDGTNIHDKYRRINIDEIPKELKYIYFFTFGNSTTVHVLRKSPTGTVQQLFDINGDFTGSAISSKFQEFITCGKITGNLNAYNIADNQQSWSVPVISNPPFPYFENATCYNDIIYVSFYDGYIKGYNHKGTITITANSPAGSHPAVISADENYLYADHAMISGTSRIFGVYYLTTGILKQQITTDYEIVKIFEKDNDNVFLFANHNGQGIMKIYNITDNGTWEPHTMPAGQIHDALQIDANTYLVALDDGIYKYQYANNSLTSYLPGEIATTFKYDDLNSEVYICTGTQILVYDYSTHTLINTIPSADTILDFQFLYNKQ
jgi:hypothetical protein